MNAQVLESHPSWRSWSGSGQRSIYFISTCHFTSLLLSINAPSPNPPSIVPKRRGQPKITDPVHTCCGFTGETQGVWQRVKRLRSCLFIPARHQRTTSRLPDMSQCTLSDTKVGKSQHKHRFEMSPRPVGYTERFDCPISCYECRIGQVSHQCFYSRRTDYCLFTKWSSLSGRRSNGIRNSNISP